MFAAKNEGPYVEIGNSSSQSGSPQQDCLIHSVTEHRDRHVAPAIRCTTLRGDAISLLWV